MPVSAGDCFILPDSGGSHLYIVLNDFVGDPPSIILTNITTWARRKDQTVILQPGEHPFITQQSVVDYSWAELEVEWRMQTLIRLSRRQEKVSEALLTKVKDGIMASPHTPIKVQNFYQEHCV